MMSAINSINVHFKMFLVDTVLENVRKFFLVFRSYRPGNDKYVAAEKPDLCIMFLIENILRNYVLEFKTVSNGSPCILSFLLSAVVPFSTRSIFCFSFCKTSLNPLNPELNPICYLLELFGAHHFIHVSRIRVKLLTLRRLMSYIYMEHPFLMFLDHTQRRSTVGRTPLDV